MEYDPTSVDVLMPIEVESSTQSSDNSTLYQNFLSSYDPSTRAAERFSVKDGAAIVNGGLSPLGVECGKALLEHGLAKLALFDTFDKPNYKVDELRSLFPDAEIIYTSVDITDEALVDHCVRAIAHRFGKLDILVSLSADVDCDGHALGLVVAKWRDVHARNTAGNFSIARAAAKCMIDYKPLGQSDCRGSIVLLAKSTNCRDASVYTHAVCGASKASIVQMTRALAIEWAQYEIRVNCISLGFLEPESENLDNLGKTVRITDQVPMRRKGRIDEVVGAVVLLCSTAGSYITGANVAIDGGSTLL